MDFDPSSVAVALANMVGTVAFLSTRIGKLEQKLERLMTTHNESHGALHQRLLTLEGRRVTR